MGTGKPVHEIKGVQRVTGGKAMYAVEMRNITKQYPLVRALDNVDFLLEEGKSSPSWGRTGQANPH